MQFLISKSEYTQRYGVYNFLIFATVLRLQLNYFIFPIISLGINNINFNLIEIAYWIRQELKRGQPRRLSTIFTF